MFKLYWFNERTGYGHPAIDYPGEYDYDTASDLVKDCPRWAKPGYRLRYEPVELHEKYTVKNQPI